MAGLLPKAVVRRRFQPTIRQSELSTLPAGAVVRVGTSTLQFPELSGQILSRKLSFGDCFNQPVRGVVWPTSLRQLYHPGICSTNPSSEPRCPPPSNACRSGIPPTSPLKTSFGHHHSESFRSSGGGSGSRRTRSCGPVLGAKREARKSGTNNILTRGLQRRRKSRGKKHQKRV